MAWRPTPRNRTRLLVRSVAVALVLAVTGAIAPPSHACACGALVPGQGDLSVRGETSIVRWDGAGHEEIVMRLAVRSDQQDAAWILPTPRPATVRLGDERWFDRLREVSEPEVRNTADWWPGHLFDPGDMAGASPPRDGGVRVHGETDIGPFHVASLSARDPHGLARWLRAHGYPLKGELARALRPYTRMGWHYVAIKLRPGGTNRRLDGELSPLRVRFSAAHLVYPMRLSGLIDHPQKVRLYVLAPHRVRPRTGGVDLRTYFAGRYDTGRLAGFGGRRASRGGAGKMFLTSLEGTARPGQVDDDIRFAGTADRPYRKVITHTEPVYILGVAGGPLLVFLGAAAGLVALAAGTLLVLGLRRRQRRAGRRSSQTGSALSTTAPSDPNTR